MLDCSETSFKKSIVSLGGEWQIYPGKLLTPRQVIDEASSVKQWNNISKANPSKPDNITYPPNTEKAWSTYTLRIILPDEPQSLSIRLSPYLSYARLYANGHLIHAVGLDSIEGMSWQRQFSVVKGVSNQLDLVLQASNFDAYRAPLGWNFFIGYPEVIGKKLLRSQIHDVLIAASLFLIGFIHIVLFSKRTAEKALLYFGLFGILSACYTLLSIEGVIYDIIPNLNIKDSFWINLLVLFWAPVPLVYFFNRLFQSDSWSLMTTLSSGTALFFSGLLLVLSPEWMVDLDIAHRFVVILPTCLYIIYLVTVAAKRKRSGFKLTLIGMALMAIALIYDILSFTGLFPTYDIAYYGIVAFMLLQSLNLSIRHADAANQLQIINHASKGMPNNERELAVYVMLLSIEVWERITERNKVALAEASGLWRVQLDGDTYRVRTMDRYLNIDNLPKKPRWKSVISTAEFVLNQLAESNKVDKTLSLALKELYFKVYKKAYSESM